MLPDGAMQGLRAYESHHVDAPAEALRNAVGLPDASEFVVTTPLFIMDELSGLIVVAGEGQLSKASRDALQALSSQVALALESAAVTEQLLRRQSEARFASLVQNSSDVVTVLERRTRRSGSRAPRSSASSATQPHELDGTKLTYLVHPDDKPSWCVRRPRRAA